jgi:SSS family solute:Na+ symporter
MSSLDYLVMAVCLLGMIAVGAIFGRLMKSSKDMFAAGGVSPWWVAGLSGFMTMFSANTFVVWGGIAYQHGMVAVLINLSYPKFLILTPKNDFFRVFGSVSR